MYNWDPVGNNANDHHPRGGSGFGGSGQFGGGASNPQYGGGNGLSGSYQDIFKQMQGLHGQWKPNQGAVPQSTVDPMQTIEAGLPWIEEQKSKAFADAGKRFGRTGMVGTPYMNALGSASRKASNDTASLYWNQMSQAAEAQAQREFQAQQAALGRDLQSFLSTQGMGNQAALALLGMQNSGAPSMASLFQSALSGIGSGNEGDYQDAWEQAMQWYQQAMGGV